MQVNFGIDTSNDFFDKEINKAINWLLNIRDVEKHGWAWVQFIAPNEQNTAEVISTFVDYIDVLNNDEAALMAIVESIKQWLLDISHAKISIDYCWVLIALQKVRSCPILCNRIDKTQLDESINECLEWLCKNRNNERTGKITQLENCVGIKGCGWGDNETELSNTIRTALAVRALNREIIHITSLKTYIDQKLEELNDQKIIDFDKDLIKIEKDIKVRSKEKAVLDKKLDRYIEAVDAGIEWMLSIQNNDGGWGNLDKRSVNREYEEIHSFSFSDLQYQCDSNAACTGYVMIALSSDTYRNHNRELRGAGEYLKSTQLADGRWNIFSEIGIRENQRYTFRHFSTAWAIQGLIISKMSDYSDECVIKGFSYLTTLQDDNYGGWKSSSNADNYTWATCNALDTIYLLKGSLSNVQAKQFLRIVCEWWELKKKETSYSIKLKDRYFAFNGATCCAFCIVFSFLISLILYVAYDLFNPLLIGKNEFIVKMIFSILTIVAAFILGLPWIVFVKNVFKKEVDGWIDSIGWVYGIITGFVLVFYQFIL